jgi:serine/threonine-protein kinase
MDLTGQMIGQYRVLEEIGKGGMAHVYRAEQPSMQRFVAIKRLSPALLLEDTFLARFEQEVRVVASLEHPAILPVYDYGEHEGAPYIVMRYIDGGTLADAIQQYEDTGMPFKTVEDIVSRVASGLDLAHRRGVVHRDLKPSNILLDQEGIPYLADFGLAKVSEGTQLTKEGFVGTPSYLAPEVSESSSVSPYLDIYALGVTLYQMVTGQLPFQADTPVNTILAHLNQPIPDARALRADLPAGIQPIIEQAMAKRPSNRFASAGELAEAFSEALTTTAIQPAAPQPDLATSIMESTLRNQIAPVQAVLTLSGGPRNGQRIIVNLLPFKIGRIAGNTLLLDDPRVSREHARLEERPDGGLWIVDCNSSNGTFVNGYRISTPQRLAHGDTLSIGDTALRISLSGDD